MRPTLKKKLLSRGFGNGGGAASFALFAATGTSPFLEGYNSTDWSARTITNGPGAVTDHVRVSNDNLSICFGFNTSPWFRVATLEDGTTITDAVGLSGRAYSGAFAPGDIDVAVGSFLGWSDLINASTGAQDGSFPSIAAQSFDAHWMENGKWVIFNGNTSGSPARGAHLVTVSDPDTVGYTLNTVYRPFNPGSVGIVINAAHISPNQAHYAIGIGSGTTRLQVFNMPADPSAGDATAVSGVKAYSTTVNNLRYSPDGTKLAIGFTGDITHNGETTRIAILDTSNYTTELSGPVITETVQRGTLEWSPDGSMLAVGISTTPFLRVFETSGWTLVSGTPTLAADPDSIAWATL